MRGARRAWRAPRQGTRAPRRSTRRHRGSTQSSPHGCSQATRRCSCATASGVGAGALLFVGPEGMTVAAVTDIDAAAGTGSATVARAARAAPPPRRSSGALPAGETAPQRIGPRRRGDCRGRDCAGWRGAPAGFGCGLRCWERDSGARAGGDERRGPRRRRCRAPAVGGGHARARSGAARQARVFSRRAPRGAPPPAPAPPAFPQGYALNGAVAVERGALYKAPPPLARRRLGRGAPRPRLLFCA